MRLKILHKLVALLLGFAILPLLVTALINAQASKEVEELLSTRTKTMAATRADTIDRILFEMYGDVQAFATNEAALGMAQWYKANAAENRIVAAMNAYVKLYDRYYLTIFVDTEGKVVAVNSEDEAGRALKTAALYGKSYAGAEWFRAVSQGQFTKKQPYASSENQTADGTYVEGPAFDPDVKAVFGGDGLSLGFSAPVHGADGKIIGYWTNRAKFSPIEDLVRQFYKEQKAGGRPGTTFTILDAQGRLLLDLKPSKGGAVELSRGELLQPVDAVHDTVVKDVLAGKSGHTRLTNAEGDDTLAGFVRSKGANGFPGLGWAYVLRVPRAEAVGALIAQERALLTVYAMVVLVVLVLGYVLSKHVAKPIVAMSDAAAALARGDIEQKIAYESTDELGQLAESLRGALGFIHDVSVNVDHIAKGNLDVTIAKKSPADMLSDSVARARDSLRTLVRECDVLIDAAQNGRLDVRATSKGLSGAYGRVVGGMNDVVGSVAAPLSDMRAVIERVAERDLSARMRTDYAGDYASV